MYHISPESHSKCASKVQSPRKTFGGDMVILPLTSLHFQAALCYRQATRCYRCYYKKTPVTRMLVSYANIFTVDNCSTPSIRERQRWIFVLFVSFLALWSACKRLLYKALFSVILLGSPHAPFPHLCQQNQPCVDIFVSDSLISRTHCNHPCTIYGFIH